jgi:hypothetical protein
MMIENKFEGSKLRTYDSCRRDFAVFWLKFSFVRSISNDFGRRTGWSEIDLVLLILSDGELMINKYVFTFKKMT